MTTTAPDAFNAVSTKPARARRPNPNTVQRQAADPAASVWVTASAGTGKTKVLTDRVLRLMLAGAAPDSILCVTFTTAAAALMTLRIREELSRWATLEETALTRRLTKLIGRKPSNAQMARARRLFARFLDAPTGMRIQTIHALAQDIIRRFPIESGVPPYFTVMDDQTASDLLRDARAQVLRQVQKKPSTPLAMAVRMVTPEVSEDDFVGLIGELTYRRGELLTIIDKKGGLEPTIADVYTYLGAHAGLDSKTLNEQLNSDSGLDDDPPNLQALHAAAEVLTRGSTSDLEKAAIMKAWLQHPERRVELFWDYAAAFLTTDGDMRKTLATKKCAAAIDAMTAEAHRLMRGIETISSMNVARGTESILRLTTAILEVYTEKKRALNMLDFDDLIHTVNVMMHEEGAAGWALHKLPGDVRHVLVDEAQDTNPDQWALISALVEELFARPPQENAKPLKPGAAPTLFVVGDEKQSIFSFQRADPREFARRKKQFAGLIAAAGGRWRELDMDITFRSTPAITQAVDAVFANPDAADGLFSEGGDADAAPRQVQHKPYRRGQAGLVEVHPVLVGATQPEPLPWALPLPDDLEVGAPDPGAVLADKIADQIKGWFDTQERLPARGRPISPADIMILVRRRSTFLDQLVRAMKKRDLPVAGVDRMSLHDQIVVMDLVALGEWLVFPRDDYKLACVLKSPLIGLNDAQLEVLAAERADTLWVALQDKADTDPAFRHAVDYLKELQLRHMVDRPYEFYSDVLKRECAARRGDGKPQSGQNALYARLGFEAEDPLVEFMNAIERYENINPPSLQGFLSWLEAGEAEVKRQVGLNPDSPRITIMTVHSAKGLEAPIVILPDTTGLPEDNSRARPRFLWPEGNRDVPLWVPRADLESSSFRRERHLVEEARDREFRRLLYVAMTRAADRLYVYGYQNALRAGGRSWHDLIARGMKLNLGEAAAIDPETGVMRFVVGQSVKAQPDGVKHQPAQSVVGVPKWARTPAPALPTYSLREKFKPSAQHAPAGANDNDRADKAAVVISPLTHADDDYMLRLGIAVHALLEFLPGTPTDGRSDVIRAYLAQDRLALTPQDQLETAQHVQAVLDNPRFASIFSPASRAEIALTGRLWRDGKPQHLAGKIDRLVIDGDVVTIVDYKHDRFVPRTLAKVKPAHLAQMAAYRLALQKLYPGKEVRCALLWTRSATLMELPAAVLDAGLASLSLSATAPADTTPAAVKRAVAPS